MQDKIQCIFNIMVNEEREHGIVNMYPDSFILKLCLLRCFNWYARGWSLVECWIPVPVLDISHWVYAAHNTWMF